MDSKISEYKVRYIGSDGKLASYFTKGQDLTSVYNAWNRTKMRNCEVVYIEKKIGDRKSDWKEVCRYLGKVKND